MQVQWHFWQAQGDHYQKLFVQGVFFNRDPPPKSRSVKSILTLFVWPEWTASGKISSAKATQVRSLQEFTVGGENTQDQIVNSKSLNIPGQWHDLSKTRSCVRHCTSCKYVLFWIKCEISSSTSTFICTVTDLGKDLLRACCRRTVDKFLNPNSCPVGTCATDTGIQ